MADLIDRQAALKKLAVYIHLIDKTMGKGTLTDDDCMESAKSVLGEDELPAAQPATNCSEIPNGSDDTISRQAVTKFLNDWLSCLFENCHKQSASDLKMIIKDFKNMPSAQPERNGKWIYNSPTTMKCDRCGFAIKDWDWHRFKFCPHCGADMRKENES